MDLFSNQQETAPADNLKPVVLITDGACIGNPGPGGWACLLHYGKNSRELSGSEANTTNNRMELTAVLQGVRALSEPCRITIVTDSEYVKKGITEWLQTWKRKGWRTSGTKQPVKNQDLWRALDEALARHSVAWEWVKGHASHADNNYVDQLANRAARMQAGTRTAGS